MSGFVLLMRDAFCWRRKLYCEDKANWFVTTAIKLSPKP
jgi:hypothetical protein